MKIKLSLECVVWPSSPLCSSSEVFIYWFLFVMSLIQISFVFDTICFQSFLIYVCFLFLLIKLKIIKSIARDITKDLKEICFKLSKNSIGLICKKSEEYLWRGFDWIWNLFFQKAIKSQNLCRSSSRKYTQLWSNGLSFDTV